MVAMSPNRIFTTGCPVADKLPKESIGITYDMQNTQSKWDFGPGVKAVQIHGAGNSADLFAGLLGSNATMGAGATQSMKLGHN